MSRVGNGVFIVRLADHCDRGLDAVLGLFGITGHDPRWRRHSPNLLTVRATDRGGELEARLAEHPAVNHVIALAEQRLYARWPNGKPEPVSLPDRTVFDGAEPIVIAGPCSIEGRQQALEIAEAVAGAGAAALRGGVFKPRSSPYDFGGLGAAGLRILAEARQRTGLPIVTEALDPACLDQVAEHADMIQIGSRNMHNSSFLFACGSHPLGKPALLKRGLAATVDELLSAAEYFLLGRIAAGHTSPGLVLCERGVRTFEPATRFALDPAVVPMLRRRTHLPIVIDPSHATGDRGLVIALAAAGLAAGAQGLLVEVHTDPRRAWCDGAQSLDAAGFRELMARLDCGLVPPRDRRDANAGKQHLG